MLQERPLSEVVELRAVSAGVEEAVAVALLEAKEVRCWAMSILLQIRIADVMEQSQYVDGFLWCCADIYTLSSFP